MKKRIFIGLILLVLAVTVFLSWELLGPGTGFSGEKYDLYIKTGMKYQELMELVKQDSVLKSPLLFQLVAEKMDYPANLKAGKYEIKTGTNMLSILRMLRNGRQTPVKLLITKLRTKEDLSALVGRKLECDSMAFIRFLENNDSLKAYQVDSNTVMTLVFPDTYTCFWNTTPARVFKKLVAGYKNFWTRRRLELAAEHGLNPSTAYILASIVEEETNRNDDKGYVASVYLNRMSLGMKLAADPTVKFALRDFELKRIYDKYLLTESPYNTYKYPGLPPGPICTPSQKTLDAVLNAPRTNYLYFVAKPDFSGYSNFSENFAQHMKYAKLYQKALDEQIKIGQAAKPKNP